MPYNREASSSNDATAPGMPWPLPGERILLFGTVPSAFVGKAKASFANPYLPRQESVMNDTLTKADIIEAIYEETGMHRQMAKDIVETLLQIMKKAIKKDHALLISGFGKFECYEKAPRKGRNPQTEESIILPGRKVVVFRLSRKFRGELNPGNEN